MRGSGEQVREGQSVPSITRASLGIPRDPGSNPGRAISTDSMKKEMVWKNLGSSS